jgi:hypothetical protein
VAFITLNYLLELTNIGIYRRITGDYSAKIENLTWNIIPGVFLFGFCILLFVSLVWICNSLKHDKHLMGNEKWMAVHLVLLTMVFGSYINTFIDTSYTADKIYAVIDSLVTLLMAFIMD